MDLILYTIYRVFKVQVGRKENLEQEAKWWDNTLHPDWFPKQRTKWEAFFNKTKTKAFCTGIQYVKVYSVNIFDWSLPLFRDQWVCQELWVLTVWRENQDLQDLQGEKESRVNQGQKSVGRYFTDVSFNLLKNYCMLCD